VVAWPQSQRPAVLGSRGRGEEEGEEERREKRKKGEKEERKKERKKREEMRKKGKRGEQERKEREGGGVASAPIAAATAVGRPRASVIRALRETNGIAPALIAEKAVARDRRPLCGAGWAATQLGLGF
jgi:hypothetical protein